MSVTKRLKSYVGFIYNPFRLYTIDLYGIGSLEIDEGILSSKGHAYDLFPISNATYTASPVQRVFGLGNVSFKVKEDGNVVEVTLRNIKDAKYITGLLRTHHQDMTEQYLDNTNIVHFV